MAEQFDERCRCLHCVTVVMNIFPKILQKIMEDSPFSPTSLFDKMMKDNNFRKKLTQPDYHTIQTLSTDGFTKLDITLIFKIITYFSNMFISPPTRGWNSNPQPNEITIGDDAQRLRLMRNHFFHKVQTSATEAEYEDFFEKVKEICQRVDTHLNLQSDESFTTLLQSYHVPPWERLTAIEYQYTEQKGLEEFLVVEIDNRNFTVYRTRSMKELLQELRTRSDITDQMEPITLTFPEVTSLEVVQQIEEELKEEINSGLVNIQLRRATEGSLVLEISVRQMVLLDDEKLRKELKDFLIRLLAQEKLHCLFQSPSIVMAEDYGFYEETDNEDLTENRCSIGGLKLHLEVKAAILQSEGAFQGEIQHLVETVASKSNGSQIFKSNPVTAILEPDSETLKQKNKIPNTEKRQSEIKNFKQDNTHGLLQKKHSLEAEALGLKKILTADPVRATLSEQLMRDTQNLYISGYPFFRRPYGTQNVKPNYGGIILEKDIREKDLSQITKRPFPTQLNLQEKISINMTQYLTDARGCCILQSGIVVAWGRDMLTQCAAIILYNSNGTIRSIVKFLFDFPEIEDVASISDNLIAVLCLPYHIFIINVLTGTVVSSIDTEYLAIAIAHRNNELILCTHRKGIMRMKLEIYKDILFDVSTSDDTGDSIKKNKDDLIYAYKGIRTVKLDEEKHKDVLSERSHIFSSQDIYDDSVREKDDIIVNKDRTQIKGKEKDKKNIFREAEDEEDVGTKQTLKSYDKHANMVKMVYVNYQGDAEVSYHDKSEIMEISNQSERKTIQAGHRFEKIGRKVEERYEIKREYITGEMMYDDEDIDLRSKIAVGSERICYTCSKKIKILDNNYKVIKVLNSLGLDLYSRHISMTMDEHCNIYIADGFNNKIAVISPDGETWHNLLCTTYYDALWRPDGINYNPQTNQLVVIGKDSIYKYFVKYD